MNDYRREYNDPAGMQEGSTGPGPAGPSKISEKTGEIREKVTDLGRRAIESVDRSRNSAAAALDTTASTLHSGGDQISGAAHSAARKIQATADYVRETDLRGMAEEVKNLIKRYPGQSLAVAAALGFLVARGFRGRD